jgi:hypothetical protein
MTVRRSRFAILLSMLIAASSVGCGPAPTPPAPTGVGDPPVTPDLSGIAVPAGQVIDQDDFSRVDSGWEVFNEPEASAAYLNGEYVLRLNRAPLRAWGLLRGVTLPADLTLSVTAYPGAGAASGGYGVICRFADAEHYYFFLITGGGEYIIGKRSGGKQIGLSSPKFQPSEAILPGGAPNRITAACAGRRLSLAINTVSVTEVNDEEFTSGQIGLVAAATTGAGLEAHFDNMAIYAASP